MPFEDAGVPDGFDFDDLIYHEPSNTLLVSTKHRGRPQYGSVWIKRATEDEYSELCGRKWAGFHHGDLVLHPMRPLVFVNVQKYSVENDPYHRKSDGLDWFAVETYDLETGEMVSRLQKLERELEYRSVMVVSLMGYSQNENSLIAKMSLEPINPKGRDKVQYWICRLDLGTGQYQRLRMFHRTFQ